MTESTNNNGNIDGNIDTLLFLEQTDKIRQEQIVASYVFNTKIRSLVLSLNHKYEGMVITTPVDLNWPKTIKTFTKELKRKNVSQDHAIMITDVADNNATKILEYVSEQDDNAKKSKSETIAVQLLELTQAQCEEIFTDQYGEPYAAVKINDHIETLHVDNPRFRNWICRAYYQEAGSVPSAESVTNAINVLMANAEFEGNSKELHVRVAYGNNGQDILYDLTDKDWNVIRITSGSWNIENSPIIFKRRNALPQAYPSKNYPDDIFDRFIDLLNIKEHKRLLLKCYIISLFIPDIDRIISMLHGGPGVAKTSHHEFVKSLVDPGTTQTLALPRKEELLVQLLDHAHISYFDNVSKIPYWMSDSFCRAATGGGLIKRRLYTDDDDKVYDIKRSIGFNGINLAAHNSDLLSRGIIFPIDSIAPENRKKKQELKATFEKIKPQVLGYIFDLLVKVLRRKLEGIIKFKVLPRMADFAEIAEIISQCMGNEPNVFIDAYNKNIELQTQEVLETSTVANALFKLMYDDKHWSGDATKLLDELDQIVPERIQKSRSYPKAPNALMRQINQVKANLREAGIVIEEGEADSVTRVKTIEITNNNPIPEDIFWKEFTALEQSSIDKKTVNTNQLEKQLIATGVFDHNRVVSKIGEMVHLKKIISIATNTDGSMSYQRLDVHK